MDQQRKCKRESHSSIQFKRRCLILKAERSGHESTLQVREGDTYVTNIGQDKASPDIMEIPSVAGSIKEVSGDVSYVSFDLETGGLARTSDILQISAIHGSREFDRYITPTQVISKGSSEITNLTTVNGQLCYDGKPVITISINDALLELIDFLKTIQNPVIVGHNIKTFDLIFLYNNLVQCKKWENFYSTVVGFVDTLQVFKKEYPKRKSYKQVVLMMDLLQETYSAHNALDDVKALQRLLQLVTPVLPNYMFDSSVIMNSVNAGTYRNTLKPLG